MVIFPINGFSILLWLLEYHHFADLPHGDDLLDFCHHCKVTVRGSHWDQRFWNLAIIGLDVFDGCTMEWLETNVEVLIGAQNHFADGLLPCGGKVGNDLISSLWPTFKIMSKLVINSTNTNVLLSPATRAIAWSSLHKSSFGLKWWSFYTL